MEQPLKVLGMLLECPGKVVTREELQRKLWSTDTFVDFEHGLNAAVKRLREALGDSADNPRYIETLPRHGYRLIIPVERSEGQSVAPAIPALSNRRHILWAAITALLVVVIATALVWRQQLLGRYRPVRVKSLVVLPLENLSRDPGQEYFSDGMTDALIANLSKIASLRVISRTSAMHYKGTNKTLPEIGRELNVDGVVEGSVLRSGNRVRITAQLIHARTEQHLWGDTYERDLTDVLTLQSEVAQTIVQQVRGQLTSQEQARLLASARTVNPQAYEAYLRGRYYRNTVSLSTPQAVKIGQSYFEEAIRKDPSFALAYVGLADWYSFLGEFRGLPPEDAHRHAEEAIRKALALDGTLGEAHAVLGELSWRQDWDWQTAEKELNNAVQLSPNSVDAHGYLAMYLGWRGRRAEALAEISRIRELAPNPSVASSYEASIYYHERDFRALVEAGERYVSSNPLDWVGHYFLAVGHDGLGQQFDAIPEYQKAVELSQGDTDATVGLAHAYAAAGRRHEAKQILQELLRQMKTSYVSPYMVAALYAALGEKDKAFSFLEKAYGERSTDLPWFIKSDLRIDALRSDPRFQDLLRRMNYPSQQSNAAIVRE
jgi:TolB-like protein/DNA-binding winged helix-turn-helix (wHTH) protein/tetratricopeptide (TPR) repeat protein